MAKLAIKGHATKGDEVIEILGILGGSNAFGHIGNNPRAIYYIDETYKNFITCSETKKVCDCVIFTLEEFLEKFPYKIGDTVIAYAEGCIAQFTIQDMRWNYELNKVEYKICSSWCDTSLMQPYKEETMDKVSKTVFDANAQCCDISNKIIKKETMGKEISGAIVDRFICLEGYDFYDDKGNIIDTKEITMKKKKPKYPKTFVECAKILDCFCAAHIDGYYCRLLEDLQALLICRDAYWKIAGDWKPDWKDASQDKFVIYNDEYNICLNSFTLGNNVLAFPTEEMRDAFYENFKVLIEECKELL